MIHNSRPDHLILLRIGILEVHAAGDQSLQFGPPLTAATTIDHVPSRACFPDRHAPEDFEFPACDKCQNATRLDELVFALYVRMSDPDDETFREADLVRLVSGVANNLPHLLPNLNLTTRDRRNSLRELGLHKPDGAVVADLPFAGIPPGVHERLERYARKILCALYYREMGRPPGPDYKVWAIWGQNADRARMEAWQGFAAITPLITIAQRRNFDFGDRFGYRCNKTQPPKSDVFAAIAGFGGGLALAGGVVHAGANLREDTFDWIPVRAMLE